MTPKIRLDEATHRYYLGDKEVPGYSAICADLGITKPNKFWTDEGRAEGVALHEWLNFIAQYKTPNKAPDPRIEGRVKGIIKFLSDTQFKIVGGECPVYDPVNRYACSPDLFGHIGKTAWIIDAKRGAAQKSHALQLGAQRIALSANGFRAQKVGSLYLKDSDYRLIEHDTRKHEARWKQFVSTWHMRKEYH